MPSPTDGPLDPFGPYQPPPALAAAHPAVRAWLRPVASELAVMTATRDKPLGQLTLPEVLAWAVVLGYAALTGAVLGAMAGNVLRVAALGR